MSGVPGTQVILEDMIVMGKTDQEHLENNGIPALMGKWFEGKCRKM